MSLAWRVPAAPRQAVDLIVTVVGANPVAAVGLGVIAVANGLLLPAFVLASGNLISVIQGHGSVALPLALVCGVFIAQRLLEPVSEETAELLARRVDQRLAQRVMRSTASPPGIAHLEDPAIADLMVQGTGDPHDVTPGRAVPSLATVIAQVVQGLGAFVIVGTYSWPLAVLLIVAYAAAFAASRHHWHEVQLLINRRTRLLRQAYYVRTLGLGSSAAKEIRVFGVSSWLVDRYRMSWLTVMRSVWARRHEGWLLIAAVIVALGAIETFVLIRLTHDALSGAIGIGTAVAVTQAVLGAGTLSQFTDSHGVLGDALSALSGTRSLEAELRKAPVSDTGPRDAGDLPHDVIRFEKVAFAYPGASEPVLNELDLDIPIGRSLAIVGGNGAGKTTIVKLLARLCEPTAGRITVDGVALCAVSAAAWQRRIAAVFQDYVEYELSAYDNVAFGRIEVSDDRDAVLAAAAEAGATPAIERLRDGWETPLTRELRGGSQISSGEWQRLALARAVLAVRSGAAVLILDEPTASLDVRAEAEIYKGFLELTRGVTTIVISHRFSTVRRADRIVVIDGGRVIEGGSHDELIAAGGMYARMYALQAARFEAPRDA